MREDNATQSLAQAKHNDAAVQLPLFHSAELPPAKLLTAEPGDTQPAAALAPSAQPVKQNLLPDYALTRSRRKTLSLVVDNGQLIVRAPMRAPVKDIESFILEKRRWIKQQLAEDARRQSEKMCL
ncbi:MAG: DUF45 domain-containing protein, partial [Pseudomonadales bacterium]|nr:DUF45 domain-containing protein [Pseudomonadales bacterium]